MKKMRISAAAAALCFALVLAGCSNNNNNSGDMGVATDEALSGVSDTMTAPSALDTPMTETKQEYFSVVKSTGAGNSGNVTIEPGDTYCVISVRDYGDIKIKLYPELAPYAVHNFVEMVKQGRYEGRTFHRIIENFMIQGGAADSLGGGGECVDGGRFKNQVNTSLRHYYGALCCASNGIGDISEGFYIVNNNLPHENLESGYETVANSYSQNAFVGSMYLSGLQPGDSSYDAYKSYFEYNSCCVEAINAMKETITDAVTETYKTKGGMPAIDGCYTVFGQTVEGFEVIDKITVVDKVDDGNGNISKPAKDVIIDKIEVFTA